MLIFTTISCDAASTPSIAFFSQSTSALYAAAAACPILLLHLPEQPLRLRHVPPAGAAAAQHAGAEALTRRRARRFNRELGGVALSFKDVRPLSSAAKVLYENPGVHVRVRRHGLPRQDLAVRPAAGRGRAAP